MTDEPQPDAAKAENKDNSEDDEEEFEEGLEVYMLPWIPDFVQRSWLSKVLRIFPGKTALVVDKEKGQLLPQNA